MTTLYEVLGAPEKADHAELRRAFRSRARELHPDLHPDVDTTARMRALNEAWAVLGDADTRLAYDRDLAAERRRAELRTPPRPAGVIAGRDPASHVGSDLDPDFDFDADPAFRALRYGDDGEYDDDLVDSGVLSVPRWVHRCIVGVIAAVIIGLVVVSAHAGPSTGRSVRPAAPVLLDPAAPALGRCVVLAPTAGLTECTAATPQRVVAELTVGSGDVCPPGVKQVRLPGRPSTLCVEGF